MIRIYCFVLLPRPAREAQRWPRQRRGWRGDEASLVFFRDVAAVVKNGHSGVSASRVTMALFHHRVVCKAARQFPAVLPCRAGMGLANGSAVRSWLKDKYRRLKRHLSRLAGRQEVGVRLTLPISTLSSSHAARRGQRRLCGQEYLRQRSQQLAERQRMQHYLGLFGEELDGRTKMRWEDRRRDVRFEDGQVVLNLYYLTRDAPMAKFRAACRWLRQRYPDIQFSCTGPWPPYNFAQPL